MKPPSLLDPAFKYVPSVETNIRRTFARVRKEMREQQERKAKDAQDKVTDIRQAWIRG